MACPYFYPTEKLEPKLWPHPPRLPLGDGYSGLCYVDPMRDFRPAESLLKDCCNLGYARKHCDRFPEGLGPDAVRFTVSRDHNNIISIYYVIEADHRPHEHGPLEYDTKRRAFLTPHPNRIVNRQAEVYVESYLRRKFDPDTTANYPNRR